MKRVIDRNPVPMLMVDDRRRYVEVNRGARLLFRMSLAEMRSYVVDDLTPPQALPTLEAIWARLLEVGCVAGRYEIAAPDGSHFDLVFYAVANVLPDRHVAAFAPADWPEDELGTLDDESAARPVAPLTSRELEVLQLAAKGFSGPRIAERLVLSPATVKTHFAHIYDKFGVGDRAAAVATGMRLGHIQ